LNKLKVYYQQKVVEIGKERFSEKFLRELELIGYKPKWRIMSAADYWCASLESGFLS
jgi:site-specific DNA-cytosine methylase